MSPGGAVAGGSPRTVTAGLDALARGGNAVDAAVAAKLMACVAEPLLTGLGGAGLGLVRMGGQTEVLDCFADVPGQGLPAGPPPPMQAIEIDFGPDTQIFHIGAASVAVPGLAVGLWTLHARYGRLPFASLVAPAIEAARSGVQVSDLISRAIALLQPILENDRVASALFLPNGRALQAPDVLRQPALANTLTRFAAEGPAYFQRGAGAQALLRRVGTGSRLTARDLADYRPQWRPCLVGAHGGGQLHVAGAPSQSGAHVLRTLAHLAAAGPLPADPFAPETLRRVAEAQRATDGQRAQLQADLFTPGFLEGWLAQGTGTGFTTHVSAVDGEGNAVGLTSSLGESAGLLCPDTGLLANNFLGEADVNPPAHPRPPGARLMTMMGPCIAHAGERVLVMGSGGSSRIRSALLHGVLYALEYGLPPEAVVTAPRAHLEDGLLRYESSGRTGDARPALGAFAGAIEFPSPGLYFGGLHIAGVGPAGFFGAGDPRRAGAFGLVTG